MLKKTHVLYNRRRYYVSSGFESDSDDNFRKTEQQESKIYQSISNSGEVLWKTKRLIYITFDTKTVCSR